MLKSYNKWRVLGIFFDDPAPEGGGFQLRELSRKAKLAPKSVKNYLEELEGEGIIRRKKHRAQGFPLYCASRESEKFLFFKRLNTLYLLAESGVIGYVNDTCMPSAIVLFGSASRGEDIKDSDIDLYVECKERKLNLEKFEKEIGRKISVLFSEKLAELSPELKNNIINGIRLKGYLKVF